ncbi:MAG: hypothetical protein ACYS0D_15185 [Planctomycetota bacterium]
MTSSAERDVARTVGLDNGAECPRCGYDQRGVVRSWTDRCPIEGACTECGLVFAWRELLHPAWGLPDWCVEARRPLPAWPAQVARTLVRAARPDYFWSRIALHQPIRWLRLLALILSLVLLLLVLVDLATAVIAAADHRATLARGATSVATGLDVAAQVATKPWSSGPTASYVYPRAGGGTLAVTGLGPLAYWRGLWLVRWPWILIALATPATTAIAFAALPVARRRAKVQSRHITRVAIYGAIVPFAVLTVALMASTWSALLDPPIVRLHFLHIVAAVSLPAATLLWWQAAVRRYLRMERPLAIAVCATSIGLLAPLAVIGAAFYLIGSG